jgi:hypothetical protein
MAAEDSFGTRVFGISSKRKMVAIESLETIGNDWMIVRFCLAFHPYSKRPMALELGVLRFKDWNRMRLDVLGVRGVDFLERA